MYIDGMGSGGLHATKAREHSVTEDQAGTMDRAGREQWRHDHAFGQDRKKAAESRTVIVVVLTAAMMGAEIVSGILFGSMALLADGLHMASHAVALGLNVFAYVYARRRANDPAFSFGTGKVNALGGYTGAIVLASFAILMAWESTQRLLVPMAIAFDQAILVAVLGLAVNGVSAVLLSRSHHDSPHEDRGGLVHTHETGMHHDHNLRSAYLHVLADALTSLLAIGALLGARYLGALWMDPLMGIVGAVLVGRWSVGLLGASGAVLLDRQAPLPMREEIRGRIEADGDSRVTDLHVWTIGPGIYAVILAIVAREPRSLEDYRSALPPGLGLAHVTVEVWRLDGEAGPVRRHT